MKLQMMMTVEKAVRNWWVSLVIGVLALFLGVWCMFTPLSTFAAMVYLFIILFFVDGIVDITMALSNRHMHGWGWILASGILDILLGVILVALPFMVVGVILIYVIGFWILFRSFWMIGESIDLQRFGAKNWGWLLGLGILGILFSFIFLLSPAFSTVFVVAFFCIALIVYGLFRIFMAFQLQTLHKTIREYDELIE